MLFPAPIERMFGKPSLANPLFVIAVYAPTISAASLTLISKGLRGVFALFARLLRWRFDLRWYGVIFLGFPAIVIVARLLETLAVPMSPSESVWQSPFLGPDDLQIARQFQSAGWSSLPIAIGTMFLSDPGPLGEELGWRGFALPRMIERRGWVAAGLLLGIVWGIWHLPAFFIAGLPQDNMAVPTFLAGTLAASVLLAWIFVGTRGSVLATALAHFMFNVCLDLSHTPMVYFITATTVASAACVALFARNMDVGPAIGSGNG